MGRLSIVATPIGNLEDISLRALKVLKSADAVLCEDTRITKRLLEHYQIKTSIFSYHQHSEPAKIAKILGLLSEGKHLALVTDAGTPGISDPGSQLIDAARQELAESVEIDAIPGASALTAALSLAGSGFDRFLFLGFLPHKKGRQTKLKEIEASPYPVVLYESKHRILKLLAELSKREVIVARELTKLHEQTYSGLGADVAKLLQEKAGALKGEFVVMIRQINKSIKN